MAAGPCLILIVTRAQKGPKISGFPWAPWGCGPREIFVGVDGPECNKRGKRACECDKPEPVVTMHGAQDNGKKLAETERKKDRQAKNNRKTQKD